jgi:hypothetical protein
MLEETYGKEMKKRQVYERHKRFHDSRAVADHRHRQMTKALNVCPYYTKRLTDEYSGDISRNRNVTLKRSQHPSQRFEHHITFGSSWFRKC